MNSAPLKTSKQFRPNALHPFKPDLFFNDFPRQGRLLKNWSSKEGTAGSGYDSASTVANGKSGLSKGTVTQRKCKACEEKEKEQSKQMKVEGNGSQIKNDRESKTVNKCPECGQKKADPSATIQMAQCQNDGGAKYDTPGCEKSQAPPPGINMNVTFEVNKFQIIEADRAEIAHFVNNIDPDNCPEIRVDGFASCDGPPTINWPLSCNRAQALKSELYAPTHPNYQHEPGRIPEEKIKTFANGETDYFSGTSLPLNRRATAFITGGGGGKPECPETCEDPDDPDDGGKPEVVDECQILKEKIREQKHDFNKCGPDTKCRNEKEEILTKSRMEYLEKC